MARPVPGSCRAAPRRLRRSCSARPRWSRAGAWPASSSAPCTAPSRRLPSISASSATCCPAASTPTTSRASSTTAITAGCGGGNYCPDVPVTRAQMAVFVWKGQHGSEPPPACAPPGTFADVPCPGGFAVDYIEGIAAEGVTAGCGERELLPEREHHERPDGGVHGQGVQHPVPAMRTHMKKQEGTAMNPLKTKSLAAWILCALVGASAALQAAPVSPRRATGAPTVAVSGTVTDGSGHGWPLYARLEITSASTEPVVVFSDPVTGAYATDLPGATAYTFAVTAVGPGYVAGGGAVVTAGAPVVARLESHRRGPLQRPGLRPRQLWASRPVRELRRRRDSCRLDRSDGFRRELAGLHGRGSVRAIRREPDRRIRPLRDPEQRLRQQRFRRQLLPGDPAGRPVGERERRGSMGQRLHRVRLRVSRIRGRDHGRRHDLDDRLAGGERCAGTGHPDRRHVVRVGKGQRPGALPLPEPLGLVVAGRRRDGRSLRVRGPAGRPRGRHRQRRQHGARRRTARRSRTSRTTARRRPSSRRDRATASTPSSPREAARRPSRLRPNSTPR